MHGRNGLRCAWLFYVVTATIACSDSLEPDNADSGQLTQPNASAVPAAATAGQGSDAAAAVDTHEASEASPEPIAVPAGLYHNPDAYGAMNLEIAEDSTFRWELLQHDFQIQDKGRVAVAAGAISLIPEAGRTEFWWPQRIETFWSNTLAKMVALRVGEVPGTLVTTVTTNLGLDEQTWIAGGTCWVGTAGSPAGTVACDDPFGAEADR